MFKVASVLIVALLTTISLSMPAFAEEFNVVQKDKQFSVSSLKVKVGDTVKFKNEDPFPHNIYSLSDIQTFDLGSHGQGVVKSVTFDKPGIVDVECAIHPSMKLKVEVSK